MRHDAHLGESGLERRVLQVPDEQTSDTCSLRVVGDEHEIEFGRVEDQGVEAEQPIGGFADGREDSVRLDVVVPHPVPGDHGGVRPLVGARGPDQPGHTLRVPGGGPPDPHLFTQNAASARRNT